MLNHRFRTQLCFCFHFCTLMQENKTIVSHQGHRCESTDIKAMDFHRTLRTDSERKHATHT
jgi:hypothetical protein